MNAEGTAGRNELGSPCALGRYAPHERRPTGPTDRPSTDGNPDTARGGAGREDGCGRAPADCGEVRTCTGPRRRGGPRAQGRNQRPRPFDQHRLRRSRLPRQPLPRRPLLHRERRRLLRRHGLSGGRSPLRHRNQETRECRARSEHGTSARSERNSSDPARRVVAGAGGRGGGGEGKALYRRPPFGERIMD